MNKIAIISLAFASVILFGHRKHGVCTEQWEFQRVSHPCDVLYRRRWCP